MKKHGLLFWILALPLFLQAAAQPFTVKMGFIFPMNFIQGQSYRDVLTLAKEDMGQTKLNYQFIIEDNNYENTRTNLAAQKLLNVDKVDVVGSVWGNSANIVEPLATRAGKLHLTTAFGFRPSPGSPTLNTAAYPATLVKLYYQHLQRAGKHRLALVFPQEAGALVLMNECKRLASSYGIEIVNAQAILESERDYRAVVLKMRESKSDAVFMELWSPGLEIFLNRAKELGLDVPLSAIDDAYDIPEALSFLEGSVGVKTAMPGQAWQERFNARFHYIPIDYCWLYYDLVRSVMRAYEALYAKLGRLPTAAEVSKSLYGTSIAGGPYGEMRYDDRGWLTCQPTLIRVKNQKIEALAQP